MPEAADGLPGVAVRANSLTCSFIHSPPGRCAMAGISMRRGGLKLKVNRRRRLGIEALEDRVTPSTFRVNTLADSVAANLKTGKDSTGHVSLRSAIQAANARQ